MQVAELLACERRGISGCPMSALYFSSIDRTMNEIDSRKLTVENLRTNMFNCL